MDEMNYIGEHISMMEYLVLISPFLNVIAALITATAIILAAKLSAIGKYMKNRESDIVHNRMVDVSLKLCELIDDMNVELSSMTSCFNNGTKEHEDGLNKYFESIWNKRLKAKTYLQANSVLFNNEITKIATKMLEKIHSISLAALRYNNAGMFKTDDGKTDYDGLISLADEVLKTTLPEFRTELDEAIKEHCQIT